MGSSGTYDSWWTEARVPRVYCGGNIFRSPEEAVSEAYRAIDQGYAGIKGNPLEDRTWPMDMSVVENCTRCVAAIREAVGSELTFC